MTTIQITQWLKLASAVTIAAVFNGVILQSATAQPNQPETNNQTCQIIRYRPEISGPDNEWIRIERCGSTIRAIPTRRGNENRGVLGVVNVVTDLAGPRAGFTRWYDHSVTRIAFQPDRCSANSASSDSSSCVITGTEELLLPANIDVYNGQFTIEYKDGELLRSITFRLPTEASESEEN
jgi:hypothetical protein